MQSSHIPTTLYWRSDTRPPEEIFCNGFTPRETNDNLNSGLNLKFQPIDYKNKMQEVMCVDANPAKVISMSTNFSSTSVFPWNPDVTSTYIYAIALPNGVPITSSYSLNGSAAAKDAVIDLHSFQVETAAENRNRLIRTFGSDYYNNEAEFALLLGSTFYGYESYTLEVSPQYIIAAYKVDRCLTKFDLPGVEGKFYSASFQLVGVIAENDKYGHANINDLSNNNAQVTMNLDFAQAKNTALNCFRFYKNKKTISSPNLSHGLGGKTFASFNIPKTPIVMNVIRKQELLLANQKEEQGDDDKYRDSFTIS